MLTHAVSNAYVHLQFAFIYMSLSPGRFGCATGGTYMRMYTFYLFMYMYLYIHSQQSVGVEVFQDERLLRLLRLLRIRCYSG